MARIWKFGSDVDTDQIVPGRFAPYMRPNADVGDAAFIEARPDFNQQAQAGDLIVAMENFGCGSSREYAVEALKRRQIGAIIAISFARIFYRNAINLGLPLYEAPELARLLQEGEEVTLDLTGRTVMVNGQCYPLPEIPGFAQEILNMGGIIPYIKQYGCFPGEG